MAQVYVSIFIQHSHNLPAGIPDRPSSGSYALQDVLQLVANESRYLLGVREQEAEWKACVRQTNHRSRDQAPTENRVSLIPVKPPSPNPPTWNFAPVKMPVSEDQVISALGVLLNSSKKILHAHCEGLALLTFFPRFLVIYDMKL